MTQILKDSIKIEYKLDQVTPISKYEMNAYNVPLQATQACAGKCLLRGKENSNSQ